MALAEMVSCKLLSIIAADITHVYCALHIVMEITKDEPYQNSVSRRSAECHCHVAEFKLLIIFKEVKSFKYVLSQ
jgi:hypothetical protein